MQGFFIVRTRLKSATKEKRDRISSLAHQSAPPPPDINTRIYNSLHNKKLIRRDNVTCNKKMQKCKNHNDFLRKKKVENPL